MSKTPYDYIYNLIGKKLSGQISDAENVSLDSWLNSPVEAREKYNELNMHWSSIHVLYEDINVTSQKEVRDRIWKGAFNKSEGKI